MSTQMIFVLIVVVTTIFTLVRGRIRQGMVLFTSASLLYVGNVISVDELLSGFSNRGVITIALLFLVSEGFKRTNALNNIIKPLFSNRNSSIRQLQLKLLPSVALFSTMLNNTPVVIIIAPIIKKWCAKLQVPASKFLIPLSYATILGGMCSLIGSSTNLVVHGMMISSGYEGFTMYELGKVGVFIAIAGLVYLLLFSKYLLPNGDNISSSEEIEGVDAIQAVISARFPGINTRVGEFDFKRQFGANVIAINRNGEIIQGEELAKLRYHENDTLIIDGDDTFFKTWGASSFFILLMDGREHEAPTKKKKTLAIILLIFMCAGTVIGELSAVREAFPTLRLDMFFFAIVTTIIMACAQLFPVKRYTKFISWDLLITIASAFAISKAMFNSGITDLIATKMITLTGAEGLSPYALLAILFIITNLFTELITNNAAAALTFPIAVSIAAQLGVSPTPFFVIICIGASASFSTPIGYQTNLIVQGLGNYKYVDFLRIGLPLNLITFILSVILIPLIWNF